MNTPLREPRIYVWRRLDVEEGLGMVRLSVTKDRFVIEGSEVISDSDNAWTSHFEVVVDTDWSTQSAVVDVLDSAGSRSRELVRDSAGGWSIDGKEMETPKGCVDVDVASTPFTNTLSIRRLDLDEGTSATIDVVWVDVPSLNVELGKQRYERLTSQDGHARYAYVPLPSRARYELIVDSDGVVIEYERFATRITTSREL